MNYKVGLTGNHYVYGDNKSTKSVYWNRKYSVWAIRVKNTKQKDLLRNIFSTQ